MLGLFDPNIEWREAEGNPYKPDGEAWIGGDAIVQNLFMRLGTEWDGFTVTPNEFHDAGDTITVECRYTGASVATGKSINAQACHVWKFRDGKVASFQQYVDTAQMQAGDGHARRRKQGGGESGVSGKRRRASCLASLLSLDGEALFLVGPVARSPPQLPLPPWSSSDRNAPSCFTVTILRKRRSEPLYAIADRAPPGRRPRAREAIRIACAACEPHSDT